MSKEKHVIKDESPVVFKADFRANELNKKEISEMANVLAVSFKDYPLFEYFAANKYNVTKMKSFWKVSLRTILDAAQIAVDSEEHKSVAVFLPNKKSYVSIGRYVKAGGIGMVCEVGIPMLIRMLRFEDFAAEVKNRYVTPNCWYLYAFVTLPELRGKGIGAKTLKAMIEFLDRHQRDCYLETLSLVNVEIYGRHGFELKEVINVPGTDMTLYAMLRPCKSAQS